ncbi:MAG: effector [Candidatus Phytoplasma stylosanthis]|uniref:effector n=1 Tax=Candidatus Phytoplasma stylosanthis TaxID=2798314 RepID=UPI002939954E|nr:effector [Candidatus Phytoplasma stylosanthis]MDV3171008.1 effector [Candidatus Phytoplasma stylosanthis]
MNKKNFLQKYFIEIMVILLLGIAIIIMIHKNHHGTSQAQSPLSSWDSEKETLESEENEIENPFSNRPKRSAEEQPIPKIKTTAARLEQIKNYLFTEPINSTLLPTDLPEQEQEEINKLKKSWQSSLDLLKEQKTWIDENQNECDEYQSQLNRIPSEIKSWENKKTPLEIQLETKEKELNRLKIDRKANETQIKKLQDEILEIVGEIGKIKVQIGKLEATQRKYQDMLTRAEGLKKDSEKGYERLEKEFKNLIYSQLNELYEITSAEG